MTDARSTDRITNYTQFWDKDRENEKADVQGARVDQYAEVVNGWSCPLYLSSTHPLILFSLS